MRSISSTALVLLFCLVSPSRAQEHFVRNAWGIAVTPASYSMPDGHHFERNVANTSLDYSAFYERFFTRSFSARFEVALQERHFNTYVMVPTTPGPGEDELFLSVDQTSWSPALVLEGDRRADLSGHEARLSMGVGAAAVRVVDQEIGYPDGTGAPFNDPLNNADYWKAGILFDAGLALAMYGDSSVFARFRYQSDFSTFDESDHAIVRKLVAFGFMVGMEFGF